MPKQGTVSHEAMNVKTPAQLTITFKGSQHLGPCNTAFLTPVLFEVVDPWVIGLVQCILIPSRVPKHVAQDSNICDQTMGFETYTTNLSTNCKMP